MERLVGLTILVALCWGGCGATDSKADSSGNGGGLDGVGEGRAALDGSSLTDVASVDLPGDVAFSDGAGAELAPLPDGAGSDDVPVDFSGAEAAQDAADTTSGCPNATCPPVTKACVLACNSTADCVYAGMESGGIYDEDNWVCSSGHCAHLGCLSDAECAATPGLDYAPMKCVTVTGGYKSCLAACATPSDCPHPSRIDSPLYGADNYECKNGVCSYVGCHSSEECQQGITGTGMTWVCSSALYGFPTCSNPCSTPSDCAYLPDNPLFGADNYACDQGLCRRLGCLSDGECADAYAATGLTYVCADSFIAP